jgi:hypothetical protein
MNATRNITQTIPIIIITVAHILQLYSIEGGSTAKPAVAKDPSTQKIQIDNKMEAIMRVFFMDSTTSPMKACWRLSMVTYVLANIVAIAKKKEQPLNRTNAWRIGCSLTATSDSFEV